MPLGTVQVPFPDSTMPGTHFQESGGRIINGYVEPLGAGAPSQIIYRRAPGLRNFGTTVRTGFRGGIEIGGLFYAAFNNRLVSFASGGGAATDIGALTGTSKGFFARNNLQPTPDKVFCDTDGNVFSIAPIAPIVIPKAPNSVCSIDGYFVFTISDGTVFASNLNSTTINPLSFATAESKADGLTRGVPWAGQLFLFGPFTTEVWANAGTTPFPFQRSVVIPRGIAGPFCVSGFEDSFSRTLCWIADDNTVVRLNGYTPEKISPPDLDGLIEQVTDKRALEMSCFISRGHAFIMVSATRSPATAPWRDFSWVFDLNTSKWAERNSYLTQRSRITGGVFGFNKWLCGDLLSGNVQEITNQVHTEPPGSQLVTGAVAGTGGVVRLTLLGGTSQLHGNVLVVAGIVGTIEANGVWETTVTDATHIELKGSTFTNAYVSGGTITETQNHPFRWRLESGAVENFPIGARVGRADFEFTTGVGIVVGLHQVAVTQVTAGTPFVTATGTAGNRVRLTVTNTVSIQDEDAVSVTGVGGTPTVNGIWSARVIDLTHVELGGSTFGAGYLTGTLSVLDPLDPMETDPTVEISWSDDGGQTYYAPIQRKLGRQAQTRELVSLIACTGRSSWNARRWRVDIADPVYVGFMAAYQGLSPKVSDIG